MPQESSEIITRDYFLNPGFIYLPTQPTTISTVLGSSVSVSLYDRSMKVGGMNHFLYPYAEAQGKATARYGNIAIVTLLKMMKANGSKPSKLEAQIFGGAYNPDLSGRDVGRENHKAARQVLLNNRVRIVSEDTGGELGRKIVFNTSNCEIVTLKVDRLRKSDWYPYTADR